MTNIYRTDARGHVDLDTVAKVLHDLEHNGVTGGSFEPRADHDGNKTIARYVVAVQNIAVLDMSKVSTAKVRMELMVAVTGAWVSWHKGLPGSFAGFWVDNTDLYIDINQSFDSLDEAMSIARERGELAIYDTHAGREIRVDALVG